MLKKHKGTIIITSLITALPMLAGLILWNKLPDKMPTHFDVNGVADSWSSKGFAVFGLTSIILLGHLVCIFATAADPKNKDANFKPMVLVMWLIPAMSLILNTMVYAAALDYAVDVSLVMILFFGLMFIAIGNYLPKCRQNYTIGIKLPWTLNDSNNWNSTHRFAGWLWMAGGAAIILLAFLRSFVLFLAVTVAMVLIPTVYSYLYYVRHTDKGTNG